MSKLWQTSTPLDTLIEKFTVWDDYLIDQIFVPYDIRASIAHAEMLERIWVLTWAELTEAKQWLSEILSKSKIGEWTITQEQEDCHTAIEAYITEHYGEVWKKIHTWRSRNDQSLTMIRLYLMDIFDEAITISGALVTTLEQRMTESVIPMPGYTHWQKAMPTTTTVWFGSFHDAIVDQLTLLRGLRTVLDQSPLGSAAGFGIASFENDRVFSAAQMGFTRVQQNPMYCGLSRGLFEHDLLSSLGNILMVLSRLNNDILLFTTSEFSLMSLPESMTTGSSIMPQKRNYDVCELVRSRIALFFWYSDQMRNLYIHLMSGYQRDLQMTKSILIDGYATWKDIMEIYIHVISSLQFDTEALNSAMTPELYLTDRVYDRVSAGESFRDAYQRVKSDFFWK
jgi:argininosuccinate lyase